MAKAHLETAIRHIRRLATCEAANDRTDRQLLHDFSVQRDQTAFTALVRRHGTLVFGVCQHVLRHAQDAEDAFQATFLVLAQSAPTIKKRDAVASWLHGVAYRTAMRAKRDLARRRFHERQAMAMAKTKSQWDLALQDLQGIVDEEIQRLPEKYRAPFVLCCLEAKSKAESAMELGWKVGTVSSRLAQARKLLQERLTRRGVTLSAVMGATALAQGGTKAAVPSVLAEATIKAGVLYAVNKTAAAGMISAEVVALAQGITKTMLSSKLKIATALLLALSAGTTGLGGLMLLAANPAETKQSDTRLALAGFQDDSNKPPVLSTDPKDDASPLILDPDAGPVPAEAIARIGSTRFRHWGEVTGLAYSPDGQWLASISTSPADSTARVWDAATGKEKLRVKIKASEAYPSAQSPGQIPQAVGFSADSKQFLVVDLASIRGFDIATGKERFAHEIASEGESDLPPGRPRPVNSLPGLIGAGLAPDAKTLVLAWRDPQLRPAAGAVPGRIEVREVATGKVRFSGEHPFGNYNFLPIEFSHDGTRFAVGVGAVGVGSEPPVPIYDTASSKQIGQVRVEGKPIVQVKFLPRPEMLTALLSGGQNGFDRAIGFYDLKNAKLVRTVKVDDTTYCFAVSPDGKLIFAGNGQKRFSQLIDAASGKEVGRVPSTASLGTLAFSPDGNLLAAARPYSGAISVYDIPARRYHPLTAEPASFFGTRFSSDGRTLLSQWGLHPVIDWRSGAVIRRPLGSDPESTSYPLSSPDGERLAVIDWKGPIRLVNTHTGKAVQTLTGAGEGAGRMVFSADGRRLASSHWDKVIRVWDLVAGRELAQFKAPELFGADDLVLSGNGKVLSATCKQGDGNIVYTWDVDAQKQLARIEAPTTFFSNIALSPDGRLVAGGGGAPPPGDPPKTETAVTIWDAYTGKELCSLAGHRIAHPRPGAECEFSPDGRLLITGDSAGHLRLWEVASGQEMHRFEEHHTYVAAHFSPDGRLLMGVSEDAPCFLWDVTGTARANRPAAALDGDKVWAQLASSDAKLAFDAIRRLVASPGPTVGLLQERLKPATAVDSTIINKLLRDLDADEFAKREAATAELLKLGDRLESRLQEARVKASPEARRRLEQILEKMPRPERLRQSRALMALEWIATPEANRALAQLAAGAPDDPLTQEAAASSERLRKRERLPATGIGKRPQGAYQRAK